MDPFFGDRPKKNRRTDRIDRYLISRYPVYIERDFAAPATRLRLLVRQFNRRAQSKTGRDSPSRTQQAVLAWLDERGSLSASDLAKLEGVRPQTMSQTLDGLERRRWIARLDHPADRRRTLISLSDAGRDALTLGRTLRQVWVTDGLAALSEVERQTLIAALPLLERLVALSHEE